jgi:hypothetical protein
MARRIFSKFRRARRSVSDIFGPSPARAKPFQEWGVWLASIIGIALNNAIKPCLAVLVDFPTLCFRSIELGAIPELACTDSR